MLLYRNPHQKIASYAPSCRRLTLTTYLYNATLVNSGRYRNRQSFHLAHAAVSSTLFAARLGVLPFPVACGTCTNLLHHSKKSAMRLSSLARPIACLAFFLFCSRLRALSFAVLTHGKLSNLNLLHSSSKRLIKCYLNV